MLQDYCRRFYVKEKTINYINLAFLFTFNSFFYTPKAIENYTLEPTTSIQSREPITLTSGLILAILTLLSACGVVITTSDMAQDMARRVYDGIKDIPGAITQVGDKVKFNIVKGVLDTVKDIVASFPQEYVHVSNSTDATVSTLPTSSKICYFDKFSVGDSIKFYLNKSPVAAASVYFAVVSYHGYSMNKLTKDVYSFALPANAPTGAYTIKTSYIYDNSSAQHGTSVHVQYDLCNSAGTIIDTRKGVGLFINNNNWIFTKFGYYVGNYDGSVSGYFSDSYTIVSDITIPYTPDTTKDVDYDTKPKEWFPSLDSPAFGGSISVPIDQPLPDISIDVPWTSPNDFVADNDISIDATDTSLPDNSVDSDSVLDKILGAILGFFNTFWDNFLSFLDGLLAPIVGLLQFIYDLLKPIIGFFGDILKFLGDILSAILDGVIGAIGSLVDLLTGILDFLLSLVDALIDALVGALEGLFVPTIDLSKAFEIPENVFVPFHEFEFDDLFNVTPKPIRFDIAVNFGSVIYPIKIHFDEIDIISNNIGLIRNIFSYTLLLASIYSAIAVFLPKRVMD